MQTLRNLGNYLLVFALMFAYTGTLLCSIIFSAGWNIFRRTMITLRLGIKAARQRIRR